MDKGDWSISISVNIYREAANQMEALLEVPN